MTAPARSDNLSLGSSPATTCRSAAGFTVWHWRRGRWWLAFNAPELPEAQASFDRFAARRGGAVRLLDPVGRELALHVTRWAE